MQNPSLKSYFITFKNSPLLKDIFNTNTNHQYFKLSQNQSILPKSFRSTKTIFIHTIICAARNYITNKLHKLHSTIKNQNLFPDFLSPFSHSEINSVLAAIATINNFATQYLLANKRQF